MGNWPFPPAATHGKHQYVMGSLDGDGTIDR